MRRLLAATRESKLELESSNLKIDWCKTVYLLSSKAYQDLKAYYEQTQDTFALRFNSQTDQLFLFDVRTVSDPSKQEDSIDLAVVLNGNKKRL